MTRSRQVAASRDLTQINVPIPPSKLGYCTLFLVQGLILVCTLLLLLTDSLTAAPLGTWQGYTVEQFGELSWKGARLEQGPQAQSEEGDRINLNVLVTDAQTGQPINQARLTLEFTEPGDPSKLKRSKKLSYSAKTNAQGHYKFPSLPKGTIRLIVTADRHQTFSKEFGLETGDQVIEVKLKKPQPLL
jgi:hypothetical protein